ncbi:MAG TPA: fasciclin domain-containing protein [Ilumatobacteraceae bacterium]|nr:fasciclin domain-containing protein [Ilumatobacteraceae bacterium]
MKKRSVVAVAMAASMLFAACSDDKDTTSTTVAAVADSTPAAAGDIVAVASSNPDFSTLVAAVSAAGLVETLQGPGPFTVFAPTNEAFAALPAGLVDKLLLPENKAVLAQILTYHVVSGKVMAADVTAGDVPTVEGSNIAVTVDGGVKLNGSSNVIATDVAASNGVIHAIDAVLLPPGLDISAL